MATVLIVEDSQVVLDVVCSVLTAAGHRYLSAPDGPEAIAAFRRNACSIGLVIIESDLPTMCGTDAVARMREAKPDVAVIYMLAELDGHAPCDAVSLAKPFRAQQLRALVDGALRR